MEFNNYMFASFQFDFYLRKNVVNGSQISKFSKHASDINLCYDNLIYDTSFPHF